MVSERSKGTCSWKKEPSRCCRGGGASLTARLSHLTIDNAPFETEYWGGDSGEVNTHPVKEMDVEIVVGNKGINPLIDKVGRPGLAQFFE